MNEVETVAQKTASTQTIIRNGDDSKAWIAAEGITKEYTPPNMQGQNGSAERFRVDYNEGSMHANKGPSTKWYSSQEEARAESSP
jgi:hypothetical protein